MRSKNASAARYTAYMSIVVRLAAALLALTAAGAHAGLVATGFHQLNRTDVLVAELSDQARPAVATKTSLCESQGKRMALASVGSAQIAPRTIPYASGCWYFEAGAVVLELRTLRERQPFTLHMPIEEFDTASAFTRWTDYLQGKAPAVRPAEATPARQDAAQPNRSNRPATPSFDCRKARSVAEHLICSDDELASLDAQLATASAKAIRASQDPSALRRENVAAWEERERTCHDKACLRTWFETRLKRMSTPK